MSSETVTSLLLPISGPAGAEFPDADLLRRGLLRVVDDRLADELEADPGPAGKPWTTSSAIEFGDRKWLHVTILGAVLATRIGAALREGARLVPDKFRIGDAEEWGLRVQTVDELLAPGARGDVERVVISLRSPTTFRSTDGKSHDASPTLQRLLGNWQRRWIAHLGVESLPELVVPRAAGPRSRMLAWIEECVTTEHQALRWDHDQPAGERGKRSGPLPTVQGSQQLVIRSPACPERDWFRTLVRFGAYSGSGRHLNVGFGQTWTAVATAPVGVADDDAAMFAAHMFG